MNAFHSLYRVEVWGNNGLQMTHHGDSLPLILRTVSNDKTYTEVRIFVYSMNQGCYVPMSKKPNSYAA